jgi:hypothetical protein
MGQHLGSQERRRNQGVACRYPRAELRKQQRGICRYRKPLLHFHFPQQLQPTLGDGTNVLPRPVA